jgi:hypothetical protein
MLITLEIDVTGLRSRSNSAGVDVDRVDNSNALPAEASAPRIAVWVAAGQAG